MTYFSRLSDIVTCQLSELLNGSDNPLAAIQQIASEMEQGLSGAKRSVNAAQLAEDRIRAELEESRSQVALWMARARAELEQGEEDLARRALLRKRELEDLLAGLQQQHAAAVATREQLTTTLRAIEARMSEVRRKEQDLSQNRASGAELRAAAAGNAETALARAPASPLDKSRAAQVEADLEALRRELGAR